MGTLDGAGLGVALWDGVGSTVGVEVRVNVGVGVAVETLDSDALIDALIVGKCVIVGTGVGCCEFVGACDGKGTGILGHVP